MLDNLDSSISTNKLHYHKPDLTVYGDIAILTTSVGCTGKNDPIQGGQNLKTAGVSQTMC